MLLGSKNELKQINHVTLLTLYYTGAYLIDVAARFRSVVVITFASHAKDPVFETQRNQNVAIF